MQDGYVLKGNPIHYSKRNWVIGEVLFVPGNPELYVELIKGGITMNVKLKEISHLITKEPEFTDIYEYDFI
jgi:hypothetical protein